MRGALPFFRQGFRVAIVGDLKDATSLPMPGSVAKPPLATGRFALAFDGAISVVKIPSLKIMEDHAFTVEAWAVLERTAGFHNRNDDLAGNAARSGFVLSVLGRTAGESAFLIRLKNHDEYDFAWGKQIVPRHQLVHFAGVYDGKSEIRFYVDGQLQSRTPAQRVEASDMPLTLGNNQTGTSGFLGRMNGVRLSKVARYDHDFTPDHRWVPDADTLALYHFDEGEGAVLKDSSGNGHHGEIMGAKWVKADGLRIDSSTVAKTLPVAGVPFTDADVARIAALPAKEQVEQVRKELMRRNPGFDGKMDTEIEGSDVTGLWIITDHVTDIAPIRVWNALRVFKCNGSSWRSGQLADLRPLEGMNLASLTDLELQNTKVTDAALVYFQDCKNLKNLNLGNTQVTDAGLSHFKVCERLNWLALNGTKVSNTGLAHFKDVRLTGLLQIENTGITDVTPLQDMPLEGIRLTLKNITRGLDVLREMKSLKTIGISWDQAWPAAEFWERYDKGEFAVAPFSDAEVQRIAALPAAEQIEEVRKELIKRNPGFDGNAEHKVEDGVVTELKLITDEIVDIAAKTRFGRAWRCRYPGGSACARIFFNVCQPSWYFSQAPRWLRPWTSTS